MPGTPVHARQYRDWLKRFHTYLTQKAGVPAGNIVVLSGDKDYKNPILTGEATEASVLKALTDAAAKTKPQDQFILFMVGLGVTTEKVPMLVLPGPDITARQIADALKDIPARNQVVLDFSAASGSSAGILARPGRVVICANMPGENTPPVFAEFFLSGLETARADGQDAPAAGQKDGVITLLEAYHWGAWNTAQWIARQHNAGENAWRVDGRESVQIFRKLYVSATNEPGSRQLSPDSDAAGEDQIVRLKLRDTEDEIAQTKRRVITEHAGLEDCGAQEPVSALSDEKKDYTPLTGTSEGEPGALARRVVLGKPDLLPAKGK
jgi:hypothetical protein